MLPLRFRPKGCGGGDSSPQTSPLTCAVLCSLLQAAAPGAAAPGSQQEAVEEPFTLSSLPATGARLIGVEYIISERLFRELPQDEKKYWHSHRFVDGHAHHAPVVATWWRQAPLSCVPLCPTLCSAASLCPCRRYEVGSGLLVAPRVPEVAERQDMQQLIGTYGKTWHMWQVDRGDPLPYGAAQRTQNAFLVLCNACNTYNSTSQPPLQAHEPDRRVLLRCCQP